MLRYTAQCTANHMFTDERGVKDSPFVKHQIELCCASDQNVRRASLSPILHCRSLNFHIYLNYDQPLAHSSINHNATQSFRTVHHTILADAGARHAGARHGGLVRASRAAHLRSTFTVPRVRSRGRTELYPARRTGQGHGSLR